ncbi:hypothetical protein ACFQE0_01605 [Methylobacterium komagatae]|uniref:Uncharacterized protein n=1 Tax=Methylobacterium komagatae TaxID=374425 RepID=A0ABW2BDP5_9HYPH
MKKTALALALAVMGWGSTAQADTITKSRFGCHAKAVTERLFQLVQAGDEAGFGQLLQANLASGECKSWKPGDEVVPQSKTLGYICLTPKDGGTCYWTPISAVEADK